MKLVLINAQPVDKEGGRDIICQYSVVSDEGTILGTCGVEFDENTSDADVQTLLDNELQTQIEKHGIHETIKSKFAEVTEA